MLYCFGDSSTYGVKIDESIREKSVWPFYLSEKLNSDFKNLSLPGGSNWRIARQINALNLNENDIVVISWTEPTRFEFGVNENYPLNVNTSLPFGGDDYEKNGNLVCKRFFNQLTTRTSDGCVKKFNKIAYDEFYNQEWYEEMFKVMFSSCIHRLEKSKCRWLMFNGWCKQYNKKDKLFEIQEYVLGYENTMANHIQKELYWMPKEHKAISTILFDNYKKIYE